MGKSIRNKILDAVNVGDLVGVLQDVGDLPQLPPRHWISSSETRLHHGLVVSPQLEGGRLEVVSEVSDSTEARG